MPQLDFEKQFKEQLKDRELNPSAESWEKLQERLEKGQKNGPVAFYWSGVAALLLLGLLVFNYATNESVFDKKPAIVDGEPIENLQPREENVAPAGEVITEAPPSQEKSGMSASTKVRKTEPLFADTSPEPQVQEDNKDFQGSEASELAKMPGGVLNSGEAAVVMEEVSEKGGVSESEIEALLEKALAEVSAESGGDLNVTDAQVDVLLSEARAEVRKEQRLYQTVSYDAENLLLEVETELEHSFREQVFEIIKEGLRKTRTAVANSIDNP